MNFYVYYKLDEGRMARAGSFIKDIFHKVEKQFGIKPRWMRRRDDPSTYMEVYEGVKDEKAFEALMEREGAKLGVPRKLERFISLERPA